MADWGLYSALRGTDDWAQKRQDQQLNLLAAEKSEKKEQIKVAESAAAEADIAKYMQELQNLEVLPEDQQRVAEAERTSRQNIVAGIAKNNGDLRRYMSTGGITALNEYKTAVMQSGEVKQAGVNKINLGNYLKQDAKGNQRHKLIDVEVPELDEEGNQIGSKVVKMTMKQQYDKFKAGEITKLNYNGSETRVKLGIEDFAKNYKNPADIYQEDNFVTGSNVYEKMLSEGASKEYAEEQAGRYVEMHEKGGDAWRWKAGDKTALELSKAKAAYARSKAKSAGATRKTTAAATANVLGNVAALESGQELRMGPLVKPVVITSLGLEEKEGGGYIDTEGLKAIDAAAYGMYSAEQRQKITSSDTDRDNFAIGQRRTLNLRHATDIRPMEFVALDNELGNKEFFVKAKVSFPDEWYDDDGSQFFTMGGMAQGTPQTRYYENGGLFQGFSDTYNQDHWQANANGDIEGFALIPYDKEVKDQFLYSQINDIIGMDRNADAPISSTTIEETNDMLEQIILEGRNSGLSDQDILKYLNSKNIEQRDYEAEVDLSNQRDQ